MTPEMMEAMKLDGEQGYLHDDPEAPIQVQRTDGSVEDVDPTALAAEGMQFAYRDMVRNGPTQPNHNRLGPRVMTKQELEEQKMNEKEGYPSSLNEAKKVKELESKVANIETGIQSILSHLSGQSSPEPTRQRGQSGGNQQFPAVPPTLIQGQSETAKQRSQPSTNSDESTQQESEQRRFRKVTLKDGRTVSVPQTSSPATSLGPASNDVEEDDWSITEKVQKPEEPKNDPKLERAQKLFEDVVSFLQANDAHKFWRRHVANSLHRHLGYTGWSRELQQEFDEKFQGFLNDPTFVSSICRKIADMEMGYAISEKNAASFVVATAGFTALALCGL